MSTFFTHHRVSDQGSEAILVQVFKETQAFYVVLWMQALPGALNAGLNLGVEYLYSSAETAESQGRGEATTSSVKDEAREAKGPRRSREIPQMAVRKLPSPWRPRIAMGVAYKMP